MNINELIKQYRTELGMTQEEVAEKLFIAKNTYNQYEKGTRNIETNMFFNILNVFGISTDFSYEPSEEYNSKALIVYKDKTEENSMFQIECYDYDPIRKRFLNLESVNGSFCHPGWLDKSEGMMVLDHIKNHFKWNISHIEWLTYDDFNYSYYKNKWVNSSTITCSLGLLSRFFQKCIEEKKGFIPKIYIKNDEELLYFTYDEEDEPTKSFLVEETEIDMEEEGMVEHLFLSCLNKKMRKTIFDSERDVFHLFFK